jgi:SNF2 family DNA or RNA helicase
MSHSNINEEYKQAPQPEGLRINLFPHQLVSIHDMEQLERHKKISTNEFTMDTTIGILGDIPGYGKSYSVVGLILRDKMEWDEKHPLEIVQTISEGYMGMSRLTKTITKHRLQPNLIIASTSIISQWEDYFSYTNLKVTSITNNLDIEHMNVPDEYDVIICSPSRYNDFVKKFCDYAWKRIIFDEAASTHIPKMEIAYAGFYWMISATYSEFLYMRSRRNFLSNLFYTFNYEMLNMILVRNQDNFVKNSFKMPVKHVIKHTCVNPQIINIIRGHVSKEIEEMISAGNVKGAIESMGGTSSQGNLINMVTNKLKLDLEEAEFKFRRYSSMDGRERDAEAWNKKMKDINEKIETLKTRVTEALNDDCSICADKLNNAVLVPCCQHIFCGECVINWIKTKNTCPMCRSHLIISKLVYINENKEDYKYRSPPKKEENKILSKPDTVAKIIKNQTTTNKDSRFIVFSSWDETFDIIKKVFSEHEISFMELNGHKSTRQKKLKEFREGKYNVVFLNSRFNGAGINLEFVSDIIMYHEMNSSLETQVVGRALRIGREGPLNVHHLLY